MEKRKKKIEKKNLGESTLVPFNSFSGSRNCLDHAMREGKSVYWTDFKQKEK